jgi:hypothetical protein
MPGREKTGGGMASVACVDAPDVDANAEAAAGVDAADAASISVRKRRKSYSKVMQSGSLNGTQLSRQSAHLLLWC